MFQVIINNDRADPKAGITDLMHKPSQDVKMVRVEISDGLYETVGTVCDGVTKILTGKQRRQWHQRLGHCSSDVLKATLPHVRGIKESDAGRGD